MSAKSQARILTHFFADYRNRNNFKMQDLKESVGIESRSTILNPEFVKEMIKGGESSLGCLVEIATNIYGWNVAKPEVIDEALWREMYQIYVEDKLGLNIPQKYQELDPKAMIEVTAVMLETIRKGMWLASDAEIQKLVDTHAALITKNGATGGGMASSNIKLQDFVAQRLTKHQAREYQTKQQQIRQYNTQNAKVGMVMSKEQNTLQSDNTESSFNALLLIVVVFSLFVVFVVVLRYNRRINK